MITQQQIREYIDYNHETGSAVWKERERNSVQAENFNARWVGKEIGFTTAKGYRYAKVHGKPYMVHRLIWLYVFGFMPEQVDHINGDRVDNRLCNLREVTNSQNCKNQKTRCTNKTGVTGVYRYRRGRWWAEITVEGDTKRLGIFEKFDDACAARWAAERRHGFHPNHGRRD